MPRRRPKRHQRRRPRLGPNLEKALAILHRVRGPLLAESERLRREDRRIPTDDPLAENPHLSCTRQYNQMRITPLEAIAILRALRSHPRLKGYAAKVRERIVETAKRLKESERRQNFDCPLLEGERCLVHQIAKPIGCLAWNPGRDYTELAWKSFARRDRLNDDLFPRWELRAIPRALLRYLDSDEARPPSPPRGAGSEPKPRPDTEKKTRPGTPSTGNAGAPRRKKSRPADERPQRPTRRIVR